MKKILLLLLIAATTLTACEKDDCSPEQTSGSFEEGKTIAMHYDQTYQRSYFQVENGQNIVFRYNHTGAQCDDIMDDEWGYTLTFEVDKAATQFRYKDGEFAAAKGIYLEFGAWVGGQLQEIESGQLVGLKISSNKWRVKANVTIKPLSANEQPKQVTFDRVFEK